MTRHHLSYEGSLVRARVERRRAYAHGQSVGRCGRKAESAGNRTAIRVRGTSREALFASGGGNDARVLESQGVPSAGAKPYAVRRVDAGFRTPQSATGQPGIASNACRAARITGPQLAAYRTPRLDARRERVEERHAAGRLRLAEADAPGSAGAGRLAVQKVLAVGVLRTRCEGRAAVGVGALGALSVTRGDRARARARPAVLRAAARAADGGGRAACVVRLADAELGGVRRTRRASGENDPGQRNGDGRVGEPPHSLIGAPGRPIDTTAGRTRATTRRKPSDSRDLTPGSRSWTTRSGVPSAMVPFVASHA
jgi:hypothetical protein